MKDKKRYYSVDWMKALAIFFVIFYHTYKVEIDFLAANSITAYFYYFLETLFTICVPLFFTVNGFLLLGKPLDLVRHIKKMIRLFLLTVFWDVICCLFQLLILNEKTTPFGFLLMVHDSEILWFLRALFVIYAFFPLIKEAFDKNKKVYYLTLAVIVVFTFGNKTLVMISNVVGYFLGIEAFPNNYNFFDAFNPMKGMAGYSFVYFMLGGWFSEHRDELLEKKRDVVAVLVFTASWLLLFLYGVVVSRQDQQIYDIVYSSYGELFTCLMTLSIFYVFFMHFNHPMPNWLGNLGGNTLGIYCVQWPLFAYVKLSYGDIYGASLFYNFLVAVGVLMVCNLIVQLIRRIPLLNETLKM